MRSLWGLILEIGPYAIGGSYVGLPIRGLDLSTITSDPWWPSLISSGQRLLFGLFTLIGTWLARLLCWVRNAVWEYEQVGPGTFLLMARVDLPTVLKIRSEVGSKKIFLCNTYCTQSFLLPQQRKSSKEENPQIQWHQVLTAFPLQGMSAYFSSYAAKTPSWPRAAPIITSMQSGTQAVSLTNTLLVSLSCRVFWHLAS